jgi:hypothetical protein
MSGTSRFITPYYIFAPEEILTLLFKQCRIFKSGETGILGCALFNVFASKLLQSGRS